MPLPRWPYQHLIFQISAKRLKHSYLIGTTPLCCRVFFDCKGVRSTHANDRHLLPPTCHHFSQSAFTHSHNGLIPSLRNGPPAAARLRTRDLRARAVRAGLLPPRHGVHPMPQGHVLRAAQRPRVHSVPRRHVQPLRRRARRGPLPPLSGQHHRVERRRHVSARLRRVPGRHGK